MLREIMNKGKGNHQKTDCCLYDIASLHYKFNETVGLAEKYITNNPGKCDDLEKNLSLLQQVVKDLANEIQNWQHPEGLGKNFVVFSEGSTDPVNLFSFRTKSE